VLNRGAVSLRTWRLVPVLLGVLAVGVGCGTSPSQSCPGMCSGCCTEAGECVAGDSAASCGANSAQCVACGAGQSCSAGLCVGGAGGGTGGGAGGGSGGSGGSGGGATGGGTGGGSTVMAGTFTVSGTVTYDFVPAVYSLASDTGTLDFAHATQRPVRNGQVRVLEGTTVLASTTTAADGTYSLTFTSAGTGALTVQAVARSVSPEIIVQDNTSRGAVWAIAAAVPVGGGTCDLHATHGWTGTSYNAATRTAAPFAILDSMYGATQAFLAARPALNFPTLRVNWSPRNTTDTNGTVENGFLGTSYYDFGTNQIYIVGKDGVDTDEYDNHVIVHEWGHFFESNVSRSDSIGGDHSTGDVLDPRDAFAEGWGNAASAMLTGSTMYVDTYFANGLDGWGFDLETEPSPTDDPRPGVFSESSVMRLLYDAFDATNEAGFDRLSLGLGPIADAFTGVHRTTDALTTLGSFITGLKASGANAGDVDTLLANYGVGPITTVWGDGDPGLRAKYVNVTSLPLNQTVSLNGREPYNFSSQNKYWVLTGTGAPVTVKATSAQDVELTAFRRGVSVAYADDFGNNATETITFTAAAGTIYVINLLGYGSSNGTYNVTVSITSP